MSEGVTQRRGDLGQVTGCSERRNRQKDAKEEQHARSIDLAQNAHDRERVLVIVFFVTM